MPIDLSGNKCMTLRNQRSLCKVGHTFQCATLNESLRKTDSKGMKVIKNKMVQGAKTGLKTKMKIEK